MAGLGRGLGALLSQSTTKSAKVTGSQGVVGQDLIVRSLKSKGAADQDVGALQVESNPEEVLTPEVAPAPKRRTTKPKTTARRKPKATVAPEAPAPAPEAAPLASERAPLEPVGAVQGNLLDDVTPEQEAKMQQILDETRKRTKPKRRRKVAETAPEPVKQTAQPEEVKAEPSKVDPKAEPASMDTAPEAIQAHMAAHAAAAGVTLTGEDDNRIHQIALSALNPSSYQPRDYFDDDSIKELASSILEHGLLEPLIVKRAGNGYEIICGERRYRAAKLAGMAELPCLVRDVVDEKAYAIALIENIQRENLNPIEEALGVRRLQEEFGLTHEECAKAIGRSRSATTNLLRLLGLNEEVQAMLARGELEMGHARALLALEGAMQVVAAKRVALEALSVRQTENLVKKMKEGGVRKEPKSRVVIKTRDDERLEEALAHTLGTVVKLSASPKGKGKIVIEFSNLEQLQGIVDRIQR